MIIMVYVLIDDDLDVFIDDGGSYNVMERIQLI